MISWSKRRQVWFVGSFLSLVALLFGFFYFSFVYRAPSCSDGIKNHGEERTDCGGPCSLLCKGRALPLVVDWARAFPVGPALYNAVAYVENRNRDAGASSVPYVFRVHDAGGILIYEHTGTTAVPPGAAFLVIESMAPVGNRIPLRTSFEFTGGPVWRSDAPKPIGLRMTDTRVIAEGNAPRVEATLRNDTLYPIKNIEAAVVLYDANENAIGASESFVSAVPGQGSYPVVFSWNAPFATPVSRVEPLYFIKGN